MLALVSVATVFLFSLFVIVKVGGDNNLGEALNPSSSATGFSGVLFGVLYGVLLFTGFETSANLGEETEHPKRDIPRAVLISVLLVAGFYFVASYAQVAGFKFNMDAMGEAAGAGPLFVLASSAGDGGFGSTGVRILLEVVVVLDMLAVLIGCAVAASRGLFALARDRRLPAALANVSSRSTPLNATVVVLALYVLTTVVTLWVPSFVAVEGLPHYVAVFSWMAALGGFALAIIYLVMSVGAVRGLGDHRQPWKVYLAVTVSVLVTGAAIFGAVYKVPGPDDLRGVHDLRRHRRQLRARPRLTRGPAERARVGRPLPGGPGPAEALTRGTTDEGAADLSGGAFACVTTSRSELPEGAHARTGVHPRRSWSARAGAWKSSPPVPMATMATPRAARWAVRSQDSSDSVRGTSSRQNAGRPSASSVYWPGLTHSVVKPSATRPGTCSSASGRLATASSAGNRARTPPTSSRSDGARPASARAAAKVARSASEGRPSGCQPLP